MCRTCIICRKPLNDGIIVYGKGICESCEKRLLIIDEETDFYDFYKNCIKKNLVRLIPRGVNENCRDYQ
ncbi:MAG: sigma factor G inhibitor Gin [Clostridium sp.]|uniref:sigma factor G inhibitor Gin n=1 Tax=Clostridium culturomicium TaxID=1499683 RepID=UPI00058FC910|nr:sigma factor G inhibitor Gin [Clostridium culturomicium]MDU4892297.1 sigma factor G inhibitor Gin [Clostridium sp.]MDU7085671.1 sigma factor G inhibitor Gin [Clostridium sp.]